MTGLIEHFQHLARYNRLANQRLFEACGRLDDAARKQARPAFFGSIHGTLNHILLGDRIWMARFEGRVVASTGLDTILYEDFGPLWTARQAEDAHIEAFAAGLTPKVLEGTIRYVNHAGLEFNDPVDMLVAHFFNHQTHHRGQVHDMLSQTQVPPPSLDLHRVLRPAPDAKA